MSFLLKDTFHNTLVETVYDEILSGRSIYHYFIGRVLPWSDETSPPSPEATSSYEYDTRNGILSVKKVNSTDVSLVIPRRDWATSTVYDQYDENYSATAPASSGATSLKTSLFYVMNTTYGVYKCIGNNNGAASTVEPTGTDLTPTTYSDGYTWKYMYTIPPSLRNRFLTDDYIPVQKSVYSRFYSGGAIDSIIIDNAGSGYLGNSAVTLTVSGTFNGGTGNSVANLTAVLNETGQFLDVVISNSGANYSNAIISITDSRGTGTSYYQGLSNVIITNVGAAYYSNVTANTTANVYTTGAFQPGSNAKISLNFTNNVLSGINILNKGSGYSTAVSANTAVAITTTGTIQPTTNATANAYFAKSAVLTPVIYNGYIDRVVIEDPGTNYSANNQTFISLVGDGTGAILTPFVNTAGQIADVYIEERGQGYTYADLQFIGDGTSANARVNLTTGDLNSEQSGVELAAINGAIYALRIHSGGDNYANANITITGDGTGFIGNVVISNNTITSVTVVNPGYGYSFANVVITGNASSGNANVSAILSPYKGHGFNPVKELFADTIMLFSTINDEKNQGISIVNDYRQFGLIRDIKQYNSEKNFSNIIGSAGFLISVSSVGSLTRDTVLTIKDDSTKVYEVVEVVSSTNQILLNNKNNYTLQVGYILNDPATNTDFTITSIDRSPTINKFSGDMLFIDNRTTVSYSDEQLVKLRTIIEL
jgi:membrane-bound inhibitor of C-type lysozyme